ncbi:hypothetical protein CRE_15140 [Caenorhabditis remanei]|uniref:Serpentine receptor class gamma n=1 Tax=Caenorhabditis remanei TaxID=31234 RepID=E3NSZ4_CAERE|nr:hypothetical protein CRE_15140 [Caenorhabditis remanei]
MFLIIFKVSQRKLGTYKVFDDLYISFRVGFMQVWDMLTVPEIFSKDSAFFVMIKSDKTVLPDSLIFSATVMFSSMYGTSIAIFAIHFVYRYVTVTGHSLQSTFVSWKFIIWLFFPFVFGLLWSMVINLTLTANLAGDLLLE